MREDDLLLKIQQWCHSTHTLRTLIGSGDDAAAIYSSGRPTFLCSDLMIEGTHWNPRFSSAADVGFKAMTRSLSDIAAMGGTPLGVTLSIALPKTFSFQDCDEFLTAFFEGAREASGIHSTPLLGGDLSRTSGPIVIDVSAVGETHDRGSIWRRDGVRPGDLAFVTGHLGGAEYGRSLFEKSNVKYSASEHDSMLSHRRPKPRLDIAAKLAQAPVHAAMDLSDGLIMDAIRMARASTVSLIVETWRMPIDPAITQSALQPQEQLRLALTAGDGYELLLAVDRNWARSNFGRDLLSQCQCHEIGYFLSQERATEQAQPHDPQLWTVYLASQNGTIKSAFTQDGVGIDILGHDPFHGA